MKKASLSLLILLIAAFLTNQSYCQIDLNWKWMHPKPQGNTLRFVKMFSATNWVAVGYAGAFMSTTNGGSSWTIYENAGGTQTWGLGRTLYNGWFFNMNTGLVCGSSGWIGRTTNGGASWDSIASGVTATLYGMHFVNSNTGFIGGTSGTILKTTNAGVSWGSITSGTTSSIYNIFALDANHIYAPLSTSGYLRITTDGGANWTQVSTGGTTLYDAGFMDPNTGFVCGSSGHVKVTTNGGANWTSVNPGTSTYYEVTALAPMGLSEGFESTTFPPSGWLTQNVLGTNVWTRSTAQHNSGVASAFMTYQSTGGEDWLKSPPIHISAGDSVSFWARRYLTSSYPPDSLIIKVSATADTNISSFTGVVLKLEVNSIPTTFTRYSASLNAYAGQTVRVAFQHKDNDGNGCYVDDIYIGPVGGPTPSQVFITGDPFYIYKSTNLGANWTQINHLNSSQIWTSTFYSMDINGNAMVAVGASGLMNRSTNGGANWTNYNTWILAGTFYDVWAEYNNGKVIAVGSGSNDTKGLRSLNGGTTWTAIDIPTTKYFRSISMVNTNTGYIAGSSGGMFKTTNGGVSWDSLPFPSSSALLYRVDFVNANTGWAVSSSSPYIWKSTNGGQLWNSQTGPTTSTYCVDMVDANTGWLVGSSGNVRKTVDGGSNWVAQTSNYSSTLYWIKMFNATSGYLCGGGGTLRRTTNGGTSWDTVSTPYSTTHYAMDWANMNNGILVGSSTGYTCKTTNGGSSWSIETTSGSTMYGVYMRSPDSAWSCGSIQGLYKWAKAPQSVANWSNEIPKEYTLLQNYPNPFNPVTTIKFGIPKAGKVSLNIYDITGRLAASLLNDAPLNAGTVTYRFDGSNFASGVYFYTLIVDDNKIDTKKMVLVK